MVLVPSLSDFFILFVAPHDEQTNDQKQHFKFADSIGEYIQAILIKLQPFTELILISHILPLT